MPLLHQRTRGHDHAPLKITSDEQFLDEQTRHDGFARAWIVSEQEAQRLAWQHLGIDRRDLMRQRFDPRSMDSHVGIEQVREPDAHCFRCQPEQMPIAVEAERTTVREDIDAVLFRAEEKALPDSAINTINYIQCV